VSIHPAIAAGVAATEEEARQLDEKIEAYWRAGGSAGYQTILGALARERFRTDAARLDDFAARAAAALQVVKDSTVSNERGERDRRAMDAFDRAHVWTPSRPKRLNGPRSHKSRFAASAGKWRR
jgi:hypothetical protein